MDMNHMTRIVAGGRRVPSEVIEVETGKHYPCAPVDGREMVQTGKYIWAEFELESKGPAEVPPITDGAGVPLPLEVVVEVGPPAITAEVEAVAKPTRQTSVSAMWAAKQKAKADKATTAKAEVEDDKA